MASIRLYQILLWAVAIFWQSNSGWSSVLGITQKPTAKFPTEDFEQMQVGIWQ